MKKLICILTSIIVILIVFAGNNTARAAQDTGDGPGGSFNPIQNVFGKIVPPDPLKSLTAQGGAAGLSSFLSTIIRLIYTAATIVFVFMVVISAFQWILSGGDKEAVAKARGRLTYAIIGIVLLAFAFFIMNIIGSITGFKFFS